MSGDIYLLHVYAVMGWTGQGAESGFCLQLKKKNFTPHPSKSGPAKSLYTRSERLSVAE